MKVFLQRSWQCQMVDESTLMFSSLIFGKAYRIRNIPASFLHRIIYQTEPGCNKRSFFQCNKKDHSYKRIKSTLKWLIKKGVLITKKVNLSSKIPIRYCKQIEFFDLFESSERLGIDIQNSLKNTRVLIIGLGGYGTWLSLLLCQVGVGEIIGVDYDIIEKSNLNRQIFYKEDDIGKYKAQVCAEYVKNFYPDTHFRGFIKKITSRNDLEPLLESVQLVFNLTTYCGYKSKVHGTPNIVNFLSLEKGISCLNFGGNWIGPLCSPQKPPCYFCALEYLRKPQDNNIEQKKQIGSFSPHIALTASIVVWEAVAHLCNLPFNQTYGNIIKLNRFKAGAAQVLSIKKSIHCKHCNNP